MGKQSRFFRQSRQSSGNRGNRASTIINRFTWHKKILNLLKVRGKGEINNGQS